jgi:cellulose synthase/poly-beta-1,6-N-acetylglucosamine synthase-like glycosyltransferase
VSQDRPATPWALLIILLVGLITALATQHLLAPAEQSRRIGKPVVPTPEALGPVVDLSSDTLRSARAQPGRIGIALVDVGQAGPFAEVDDVLRRHDLAATWFLQGGTILDRPSVLDVAGRDGSEIGVTGFTGRDLAALPDWRVRTELSATQSVLAARGSIVAPLLLLPTTASPDRLDSAAFHAARTAAQRGYGLVVGVDPEIAGDGDVAVVELDEQAAARIEALTQRATAEGLQLGSVSAVAAIDRNEINRPAATSSRLNGWAVVVALRFGAIVTSALALLFWPVTVLVASRALAGVVLAVVHARRRPAPGRWAGPVTVIVPAYNEVGSIEETVVSVVASRWPHPIWVLVVDDGSTDGTADVVESLGLPGVSVIKQPNAGKAAALNRGLAAARTDVVVLMDADTLFEPDTIEELVVPFADPLVGASSGNVKVLNRRRLLGRWQHIEYVMGFNLDRRLLAVFGAILTVPGAAGAFRTIALREMGGVSEHTLAEDTDLTMALTRRGWRVIYREQAIAWTEAPSNLGDLWRQRYRWCYGTLQAAWKHRRSIRERSPIGLVGLPYAVIFQVLLALLGPVVDVAALYGLTTGAREVAVAWLGFTGLQLVQGVVAFRLDHERLRGLWAAPLQQIVYRQLMYLVVIQSVVTALAGNRLRWHKLRRIGFVVGDASPTVHSLSRR